MKKVLIAAIAFNILTFSLYANGIALSTQSKTNEYSWIKGRQIVSVNLAPGYAGLFPPLLNTMFDNISTITGIANFSIGQFEPFLDVVEPNGSFWYIPNISYTLLVHPRIGVELGFGVQSASYDLRISKDKLVELVKSGDIPGIEIPPGLDPGILIGSDTIFSGNFIFLPLTLGVKFYGGKNRQVVNTFRFGLETLIYDIKTENGLTGVKTKRTTTDTTMYFSYELGWSIELFPTREWPVKPYIDISLLEIGYYVRSSASGIYNDVYEGIGFFGGGLVDITAQLPTWDKLPGWINYVSAIKFALFPRIGFSLRF